MIYEQPTKIEVLESSFHALAWVTTPFIIKANDCIKGYKFMVLINLTNTHNFIDVRVANKSNFFIHTCQNFKFMVVNGWKITYISWCKNFHLAIGDFKMQSDYRAQIMINTIIISLQNNMILIKLYND